LFTCLVMCKLSCAPVSNYASHLVWHEEEAHLALPQSENSQKCAPGHHCTGLKSGAHVEKKNPDEKVLLLLHSCSQVRYDWRILMHSCVVKALLRNLCFFFRGSMGDSNHLLPHGLIYMIVHSSASSIGGPLRPASFSYS